MQISEELAKSIYDAKGSLDEVPDDLIAAYAQRLMEAVLDGLGEDAEVDDAAMYQALKTNVYQFSAAKSYTQMKSLTEALLNDDGKLRTWSEFKLAAIEINDEQVMQWLQAEYDNAVACSQMAYKWQEIESNKHSMPYLEYVTANDGRVRPAHAAMNHTIRRVDDPYWNQYYPPNGWNCRCTVKQIGNATVTPQEDLYHPTETEVPKMFRFNPGKDRMAFPPDHPYFEDAPKSVLHQGLKVMKDE